MGDVIPLRQYTPAYGTGYGAGYGTGHDVAYRSARRQPHGGVRVPARHPAGASRPAPRPQAAPASRTVADRLGVAGLRLTRRGRVVLVLLAMLVVAPMATWGATAVASSPGEPLEVRVHAVQPGETLWGYAEQIAKPGEDVRDAVARLQELNEMRTASVRVGQLLLLPDE